MIEEKKIWKKPQLIILAKGHPEENVLLVCKAIGMVGTFEAQSIGQTGCDEIIETNCGACQSRGGKDS